MFASKRIDFFIIKSCLNNCVFCSERPKFDGLELSLSEIKKVLSEEKKNGAQLVHFVGGEPTLHSRFSEVLKLAKSMGYNIFIITNGIKFSSREFCKDTLPYLDEIMVSVHGHNSKIHGANTRNPSAFNRLIQGLGNLKKYFHGRLEATSAITKFNYKYLKEIARLINSFGIKEYQCMSIVPTGEGGRRFFDIVPQLMRLKPVLKRLIDYCESNDIKIRFSGIPMCILQDKYLYSYDLWEPFKSDNEKTHDGDIVLWREPGTKDENFQIDIGRIKTKKCKDCTKKSICGGIYQKYYQKYGDKELNPFKN